MLAILPFFALFLMVLNIQKYWALPWRDSILFGAVFWGVGITAVTEIFSLLRLISFLPILITWSLIILILGYVLYRRGFSIRNTRQSESPITIFEKSLILGIVTLIIFVGIVAWVYPPNNWDSMTYHMSRVMHWIQNNSIKFFPTSNLRELHQNPWVEYAILHFQILNKGDLFANSVQWLCMIGNIIGVSLIAKELKASYRGQVFAAFVCATIPMGILQGSSTQTDAAIGFWLVCFVYSVMLLFKKPNYLHVFVAGFSLGLGILTKATMYVYAFPFLIWLIIAFIKYEVQKKWSFMFLIATLTLIINTGHYIRNFSLYSNPLGPGQEVGGYSYANAEFTTISVTSNLIRNISLHLTSPNDQVNILTRKVVNYAHRLMNYSANDPATTFKDTKFDIKKLSINEDTTGNLWHLLFIIIFVILYIIGNSRDRTLSIYILLVFLAFLLFCAYLRWQPWHSRLHLPIFVLFSPFSGIMLSRYINIKTSYVVLPLIYALSLPFIFANPSRPIIGINILKAINNREEQYFNSRVRIKLAYFDAIQVLSSLKCQRIGLVIGGDTYEYPLKIILEQKMNINISFDHVNVINVSKQLDYSSTKKSFCALVSDDPSSPNEISVENINFTKRSSSKIVNVYTPSAD